MHYLGIDSVLIACSDLEKACAPYRRLGLTVGFVSASQRAIRIGDFAVYFLADAGDPLQEALAEAKQAKRALFAVTLRVRDLTGVVRRLHSRGVPVLRTTNVAWLPLADRAGVDLVLVEEVDAGGGSRQGFPLRRLDHLATVTHDLERKCRFWETELGLNLTGEVVTPAMVIRQVRIGDAVLELLGPVSEESPLWQRPAGLVSMISWEVDDLEGAVRQAREAGFTVPDPAPGPLPGTLIATIPGSELAGVNMQLLQRLVVA